MWRALMQWRKRSLRRFCAAVMSNRLTSGENFLIVSYGLKLATLLAPISYKDTRYERMVRSWSMSWGSEPTWGNRSIKPGGRPPLLSVPGPRLPSQPRIIIALWPVSNYTAWWQRNMGVNNLHKVITQSRADRQSNPWPLACKSDALRIAPPQQPSNPHQILCLIYVNVVDRHCFYTISLYCKL